MSADRMTQLEQLVQGFCDARDWSQFHDPKNLCMAIASEAGELAAILRWVPNAESDAAATQGTVRARLLEEMGDVGILLVELCNRLDVGLYDVIDQKLQTNKSLYPAETAQGNPERAKDEHAGAPSPHSRGQC